MKCLLRNGNAPNVAPAPALAIQHLITGPNHNHSQDTPNGGGYSMMSEQPIQLANDLATDTDNQTSDLDSSLLPVSLTVGSPSVCPIAERKSAANSVNCDSIEQRRQSEQPPAGGQHSETTEESRKNQGHCEWSTTCDNDNNNESANQTKPCIDHHSRKSSPRPPSIDGNKNENEVILSTCIPLQKEELDNVACIDQILSPSPSQVNDHRQNDSPPRLLSGEHTADADTAMGATSTACDNDNDNDDDNDAGNDDDDEGQIERCQARQYLESFTANLSSQMSNCDDHFTDEFCIPIKEHLHPHQHQAVLDTGIYDHVNNVTTTRGQTDSTAQQYRSYQQQQVAEREDGHDEQNVDARSSYLLIDGDDDIDGVITNQDRLISAAAAPSSPTIDDDDATQQLMMGYTSSGVIGGGVDGGRQVTQTTMRQRQSDQQQIVLSPFLPTADAAAADKSS